MKLLFILPLLFLAIACGTDVAAEPSSTPIVASPTSTATPIVTPQATATPNIVPISVIDADSLTTCISSLVFLLSEHQHDADGPIKWLSGDETGEPYVLNSLELRELRNRFGSAANSILPKISLESHLNEFCDPFIDISLYESWRSSLGIPVEDSPR